MPTPFQQAVKTLKKKHKFNQNSIADFLEVKKSTISRCLNGHQGNTGEKFVPDLERLIIHLDSTKKVKRQTKKHSQESVSEVAIEQVPIPLDEMSAFEHANCIKKCTKCGNTTSYSLDGYCVDRACGGRQECIQHINAVS